MKFTLEIKCDNAAFGENADDLRVELASILKGVADRVDDRGVVVGYRVALSDTNGNKVGFYVPEG